MKENSETQRKLQEIRRRFRFYAVLFCLRALPMLGGFAGLGFMLFRFGTTPGNIGGVVMVVCFMAWHWIFTTCPAKLNALHAQYQELAGPSEVSSRA